MVQLRTTCVLASGDVLHPVQRHKGLAASPQASAVLSDDSPVELDPGARSHAVAER